MKLGYDYAIVDETTLQCFQVIHKSTPITKTVGDEFVVETPGYSNHYLGKYFDPKTRRWFTDSARTQMWALSAETEEAVNE